MAGTWDTYREELTAYNNAIRKAKRDTWRKHCEEVESTPVCARLHRILSKENSKAPATIKLPSGSYTKSGKETIEELWRVHFPGSIVVDNAFGNWDGLAPEGPNHRASRADWTVSKRIITYERVKWAINSFDPFKASGPDGIIPVMLQQGIDLLSGKLTRVFRASLALGYIPMRWRHTRVVFIPKPGKPAALAKSLRPISLMSFMLKALEKLLDAHIRESVLVERPLHPDQYAYRTGASTETALHQVVKRLEKALEQKEVALGAFLDIEGAFDNTSFASIIVAVKGREL